jgi:hypothetical protein
LSSDWNGNVSFLGRALDLKKAYKQWAVAQDHLWASVITVWNPVEKRPVAMIQCTLPFGAKASVFFFNRLSRLLRLILARLLKLLVLCFYDDFPFFEPMNTSRLARRVSECVLAALGWDYCDDPAKSFPFAETFTALGVVFDLSRLSEGFAFVANKTSRVVSISEFILRIRDKGFSTRAERDSLRGSLHFLERHVFGRAGKFFIQLLDDGEGIPTGVLKYDDSAKLRLLSIVEWLRLVKPRAVRPDNNQAPLLIFTDGAEGDVKGCEAACGGLLVDPLDDTVEYFGGPIPDVLVREWRAERQKIIAQAELLPVLLAKRCWQQRTANRRVLFFVDNESAKFACVNMMSWSVHSKRIIAAIVKFDIDNQSWTWYSRVPSFSNPADPPSRLEFEEVERRFKAKRCSVEFPTTFL